MTTSNAPTQNETLFENPFQMDDLMVFDDSTLHAMLTRGEFGLTVESLAHSLYGMQGAFAQTHPTQSISSTTSAFFAGASSSTFTKRSGTGATPGT